MKQRRNIKVEGCKSTKMSQYSFIEWLIDNTRKAGNEKDWGKWGSAKVHA